MHVRVGGERSLFVSVAPLLVGVFVSFAASSIAILAQCSAHGCTDRTTLEQIPLIDKEFYSLAAQVLPALLIALAVEARAPVLPRQGVGSVPTYSESASGERALLGVSVLTFAVGAGAALAALASNRENLPLTFQLSVQAIGLGFAAIFVVAIRRNDATV
jgi:hypothetical protein